MIHDVDHIFVYFIAICMYFGEKYLFKSLAYFLIEFFDFFVMEELGAF